MALVAMGGLLAIGVACASGPVAQSSLEAAPSPGDSNQPTAQVTAEAVAPAPSQTLGEPAPVERAQPAAVQQRRGQEAPGFQLTLLDGRTLSLAELRGKPVVINFWASWCPPCRAEMPALERAWQKHKERVVFVGIAVADTETAAQAAAQKAGVSYALGLDTDNSIARAYQLRATPSTFFVDANGVVARRVAGEITEGALTFFIGTLLR